MMHNPYWGSSFLHFFETLFIRLYLFCFGSEPMELASDELQLLVLALVSTTAALIGTFFVLRKMTMLANALSHTILPGVVLAYLAYHYYKTPLAGFDFSHALPSDTFLLAGAFLSSFATLFFIRLIVSLLPIKEDAGIGMVFTLFFALGIILVTALTKSAHIGAELLMGNVDALHPDDLTLSFWIAIFTVAVLVLSWRPLFLTSFDPLFAKMCGLSNEKVNYLIMALGSLSAISAFRAVGVLLFLGFLVTPPLIARRLTNKLVTMAWLSALIALISSILGVALSRHILSVYGHALSTTGLIVTILAGLFALSLVKFKNFCHRNEVKNPLRNHS